jgi:hypothetical protein
MYGQVLLVKPVRVLRAHRLAVGNQINRRIWENQRINTDEITPKMSIIHGSSGARMT